MALCRTGHVLISGERKILRLDCNLCFKFVLCGRHSTGYCSGRDHRMVQGVRRGIQLDFVTRELTGAP